MNIKPHLIGSLIAMVVCQGGYTLAQAPPPTLPAPPPTPALVQIKEDPTVATPANWKGWYDLHDTFLKRVGENKQWPIKLVFFGDSILQRWPWEDFHFRYKQKMGAVNFGIGGDQVQHVLWRVLNGEMKGLTPKVVVLQIGTNSLGKSPNEKIAEGITKIVEAIHEQSPKTVVLLIGIFPRTDYEDLRKRAEAINEITSKLDDGGKTVRFVDVGKHFLDENGKVKDGVLHDKLHLATRGYEIWREVMDPILYEMLELPGAPLDPTKPATNPAPAPAPAPAQ